MGRSRTLPLFDDPPVTAPEGLAYHPAVIDEAAERILLTHVRALEFGDVVMRGVTARRRVVQFGWRYSFDARALSEGPAIPGYLRQLQGIAGALADVEPDDLSEVLVTEYPVGATIGWHRDAPPFGIVVGMSLLSACRFRFRRTMNDRMERADLELAPRSAYVLRGAARTEWQHSIPPTTALRYSITFRTLRRAAGGGRGRSKPVIETAQYGPDRPEQDVGQGFSPADNREVQARAEDPNLRSPAGQGR